MGVTVLVIPHAGGMSSAYYEFSQYADLYVGFKFVELAGRAARMGENLYRDFKEAVNDIYEQNIDVIREGNYVLFGHSMGSWLAYELYYKIKEEGMPLPLHMFFSGNVSPFVTRKGKYSDLEDEEFIKYILENEQTSKEIFDNPELREIFLPILRSDYSILENYTPEVGRERISCNISVLGGIMDPLLRKGVDEWSCLTSKECEVTYFEGGHFYIFDNVLDVFNCIYRTVEMCYNI